jgi:hypothetical protein
MEAARPPFALDKGENRALVAVASLDLKTLLATDEGFVNLDNTAPRAIA